MLGSQSWIQFLKEKTPYGNPLDSAENAKKELAELQSKKRKLNC